MPVAVVTDSSARIPAELRDRWGILEVPLHILIDGQDLRDGIDEIPGGIHHHKHATTAGASLTELDAAYRRALRDGGGAGVVAVHISAALSGTVTVAGQAAAGIGERVRVLDSRSAAMGTGFVALAAARAAADGADPDGVVAAANVAVRRGGEYIVVHRLENLHRSGRIGHAAEWLGTALSIKPVLRMEGGRLVLAHRVRTASKAVATMIDGVEELVGGHAARLAVHHVANPDAAADLAARLAERLPACEPAIVTELGPVLALHVGAGALAVCVDVIGDAAAGSRRS
jgi:DegV family protein with EDD domain